MSIDEKKEQNGKTAALLAMEKIGVFCSSSDKLDKVYYDEAGRLGEWIGKSGRTLVYGGSKCGLMEAVAQGVKKAGSINVVGVVPKILMERHMVSDCIGIRVPTENLQDRKAWMNKISDIMIALPGGVGTLDEAFTVLAEATIGLADKKVVFWNINGFWNVLFEMIDRMKSVGVVSSSIDSRMLRADSLEDIITIIGK